MAQPTDPMPLLTDNAIKHQQATGGKFCPHLPLPVAGCPRAVALKRLSAFVCLFVAVSLGGIDALAQSPRGNAVGTGRKLHSIIAATATEQAAGPGGEEVQLALQGFCPVSLLEAGQWVVGEEKLTTVYDGRAYCFPDPRRQKIFQADPEKYVPVLGGDSVVRYARTGERVPGELAMGVTQGGRLYFFATERERSDFMTEPKRFALADVALGGDCVVSRVDRTQKMPGAPELTLTYQGLRYRFIGAAELRAFMAAPDKYAQAAMRIDEASRAPSRKWPTRDDSKPYGTNPDDEATNDEASDDGGPPE